MFSGIVAVAVLAVGASVQADEGMWTMDSFPTAKMKAAYGVDPMGQTQTRYHVSLDVADKPGVLATVALPSRRRDPSV